MDRASGSGVFGRDPDALIDPIELPLKDQQYENMKADKQGEIITQYLDTHVSGWRERLPDEHLSDAFRLSEYCKHNLYENAKEELFAQIAESDLHVEHTSAWRVSCTLREFEKADNKDIFFSWPIHYVDESGMLAKIRPDIEINGKTIHQKDISDGSYKAEKLAKERQQVIDAYTLIAAGKEPDDDGVVRVKLGDFVERSEELFGKEITKPGIRKKLNKFGDFTVERGIVTPFHDEDDESENDDDCIEDSD
jgi:RecA-family ATPase